MSDHAIRCISYDRTSTDVIIINELQMFESVNPHLYNKAAPAGHFIAQKAGCQMRAVEFAEEMCPAVNLLATALRRQSADTNIQQMVAEFTPKIALKA